MTSLLARARSWEAGEAVAGHVAVLDGGADSPAVTIEVWNSPLDVAAGRRLLLYNPGSGKPRTDNARTASALARAGYVVVALDDVEVAPETSSVTTPLAFDFRSAEAYRTTLHQADRKVEAQARRLSLVLDRLGALAASPDAPAWLAELDLEQVGAIGWSLGGATAAEASIADRRIRAVANLDGWLFGAAAQGGVTVPYLLVLSDFPIPDDDDLEAVDAAHRYESRLTRRDLEEERRLIARPGSMGFRLIGGVHENLSDLAHGFDFWRAWWRLDPVKAKHEVDKCLAAFFDFHLRDRRDAGKPMPDCASSQLERLFTLDW